MKYNPVIIGFALFVLTFFSTQSFAITDPNGWFDECPDQSAAHLRQEEWAEEEPAEAPYWCSYDIGPYFSLDEDADADGYLDTRDNCPYLPNDQPIPMATASAMPATTASMVQIPISWTRTATAEGMPVTMTSTETPY
jgi:hypothetical protein